jgi:hypothetical protein
MNSWLVTMVTLLAAAVYTCAISHSHPEKLWDWFNTLVGSFLSFFLALLGGLWLYRKQSLIASEKSKSDLKLILASELSDTRRILTDPDLLPVVFPEKTYSALVTFIQPLAVEKAAQSSLFSPQDTENLLHFARKVRMFQLKVDHLLGLLRAGAREEYIAHATRNIEETRLALITDMQIISNLMHLNTELQFHPKA